MNVRLDIPQYFYHIVVTSLDDKISEDMCYNFNTISGVILAYSRLNSANSNINTLQQSSLCFFSISKTRGSQLSRTTASNYTQILTTRTLK